jgi:hypothetical protein
MINDVIKSNLERPIEIALGDKRNSDKFSQIVKKYVDNNSQALYANAPQHRLYFADDRDRKPIFDLVDVKEVYVKEVIKKTPAIKSNWAALNKPFNILMPMIIRHYENSHQKENLKNAILYTTLSLYSNLHSKYFKYLPNENVMTYTINNLNNKFLFKQYGVIIKALYHTAFRTHEKYRHIIARGNDEDIANYMMYLQTRVNNLMKNFTREYMKNYENKNYLNTEKDSTDEDSYFETDNVSLMIARLNQQASNRFYSSEINDKFVRVAAKWSGVSPITLKLAVESIKKSEKEKVGQLMQAILQVYLTDGNNSFESIASQRFIAYCISIYSKSNTKDKNILLIKSLLDYFLKNNSNRYSETEREATRINYRKAFYMYVVLFLQSNQIRQ